MPQHANSVSSPDFPVFGQRGLFGLVLEAGVRAMAIYERDFSVSQKEDKSPVTEADHAVDAFLAPHLERLFPGIPVVTEERVETHGASIDGPFLLVDPIDGTKEFIARTGEFTINVALILGTRPVAGIVYAPALDRMFIGIEGQGAFETSISGEPQPLKVRPCAVEMTAVASRSHNTPATEAFLETNRITERVSAGSSLKFCLLAAGEADVYPRFGPTMEWDTAAGHAVLAAAGGMVLLEGGDPLAYGKPGYRNPDFIACSPDAAHRCGLSPQR